MLPTDLRSRSSQYDELLNAVTKYLVDPAIPDLIVRAYAQAYGKIKDCKGKSRYEPLTTQTVVSSGKGAWGAIAKDFGGVAPDLPDLPESDGQTKVHATYRRYLGYSTAYTAAGWDDPSLVPNLNMDQGIGDLRAKNGTPVALQDALAAGDIFPTPGFAYVPPLGGKPEYQNECSLDKDAKNCGDPDPASPGGDAPDETESLGPATTPEGSGLAEVGGALRRLATKRGAWWPSLVAGDENRTRELLRLFNAGDMEAFHAALAQVQAQYALDLEKDPTFKQLMKSDRPDPSFFNSYADLGVLHNGFVDTSMHLAETWAEPAEEIPPADFGNASRHPLLLVPTGGLHGLSQGQQFKAGLEAYVSGGGTIIVFAQQHGSDYSVLPTPGGRPIHAWGWLEDNSCYSNAAYAESFHPILASQSTSLVTSSIDGYFDSIPDNATVLLRRVKNGMPAMFLYPYGQGWVIVSSSYDDWGGYNQSGAGARAIIRDAVAWAKKPADLPVHVPGSAVSATVQVTNVTDLAASEVRLVLMSPSRDRIVAEQLVSNAVAPGGSALVSFSHTFPADAELGIYHVDYELLGEAGVAIQPVTEDDTGRIVVARPPASSYRPSDLQVSIVMPGGEEVAEGMPVTFRYRLTNRGASERHFRTYWDILHGGTTLADEIVMAGNTTVERDVTIDAPRWGTARFWVHVFEVGGKPAPQPWWAWVPGETAAYQLSDGKGFRTIPLQADVKVVADRPVHARGDTATLSVTATNQIGLPWSASVQVSEVQQTGPGVVLAEHPVSLPPGGSANASLSIPVRIPRYGRLSYAVQVRGNDRAVASTWAVLTVPDPEIRSAGPPTCSGAASGAAVEWTLENIRPVPLTGGTLKATLKAGGATVWEGSQPLVLPAAPGGRGTLAFALPAVPAGLAGELALEGDNGFGQLVRAVVPLPRRLYASARTSAADFGASEAGAVELTLVNHGVFREEGEVVGAIDGIGPLSPAAFSLAAGESTVLRFPFVVPEAIAGRLHEGEIELQEQAVPVSVRVRRPTLVFGVEDRVYRAGEPIPVTLTNTAGSLATPQISLRLRDLPAVTGSATLAVGAETRLEVPIPAQLPSGPYALALAAEDRVHAGDARQVVSVRVAGTEATLTVATDRDVYARGSTIQSGARVTNGGSPLDGASLHLEMATPCAPAPPASTYHFQTWDGTKWVERAVRSRSSLFEMDQVDLSPFWPDPDGDHKIRIEQTQTSSAYLDYVALVSGGGLVAPAQATLEGEGDVLEHLRTADDQGLYMTGRAVVVRFPATPSPSLLYRAREGQPHCFPVVLWQKDVPLEMAGGELREVVESVPAGSSALGQVVLSGAVRTRNGDVLARASKAFEIVSGGLSVSVRTDASLYRTGTPVTISGTVRNLSAADQPGISLYVSIQGRVCGRTAHEETLSLVAGETRDYSFSALPSELCPSETDLGVTAQVWSPSAWASSDWAFRTGAPKLDVGFEVPDPAVRLVTSTSRLVSAEEADLDAVTRDQLGSLDGALPFPVVLGGVRYVGFRQSVAGFVELVPEGSAAPTGQGGGCLDSSGSATILAGFLADLDPSVLGFVGHKRYPAGSMDRTGRVFARDTLVFFWDAPLWYDTRENRFQILLAEDGLVRIDAGPLFPPPYGPAGCSSTGLSLPSGRVFAFNAPSPFGLRAETGIGRAPFQGSIVVRNSGTYPGAVSLDYGKAGGTRTLQDVTVPAGETRTVVFQDDVVAPTTYTLVASGDASLALERTVRPSEGLVARYTGAPAVVPGPTALPFRLTKTGGLEGPVTVVFTLTGPAAPQSITRAYDLQPGIPTEDLVTFDLPEGSWTLSLASPDAALEADTVGLRSAPRGRVDFAVAMGAAEGGVVHFGVDIANTGLSDFAGEVQVEADGGSRTPVAVGVAQTAHIEVTADVTASTPGPSTFVVRLVSQAGVVLGEKLFQHEVTGPRVAVVDSPAGQVVDPGGVATLRFRLRNTGDQRAIGTLRFGVFDEDRVAAFDLPAGAEGDVAFDVLVDDDVEEKVYPGRYVLQAQGMPESTGQVSFTVNGIALDVQPSLDKEAYRDGETAHLTVAVTNGRAGLGTNYLVRVHYGAFEEVRPLSVAGTENLVFDVPLEPVTGEPVFLGITHPDGRSLYINTLHVRKADALATVTLDQQAYAPGAAVTLSASASTSGTLTLSAPGYSEALTVSGAVTRSFTLPADLPGGTYFVSWSFVGAGDSGSGSVPFDVAGLRVRVLVAQLEKGRYGNGETIKSTLQVHTSEPAAATLRGFVLDPEGVSTAVGDASLALHPDLDLQMTNIWPFSSSMAGLHRFVYGIYLPGGNTLLASGSLAFDVGNGAVLGFRTDRADYPQPGSTVRATVSAFVSGPVELRLEVDGRTVASPEVEPSGIVELPVDLDGLASGQHELVAVMTGDGYTSRASTSFALGTALPDLVAGLPSARPVSGASWKIDITVSNAGGTDVPATGVVARDAAGGTVLGQASVPALVPGGSTVVSIAWNALGFAGGREIEAEVDPDGRIQEFREDNNRSRSSVEVPSLVIEPVSAPSYPANVEAGLGASVTNLSPDETYEGLVVVSRVIHPDGTGSTLAPSVLPALPPRGAVAAATPWAVGRSAPGGYLLRSDLRDAGGSVLASGTALFQVDPTHAFAGTAAADPSPAVIGASVHLSGHVENHGNVEATGTARFDLVAPDGTIAAAVTAPVTVPLDKGRA